MKKLGILGILVFLVALAFVPQGVMAAPSDNATLTINAGVQHAIEVSIDALNESSSPEYNQDETYNRLDFDPQVAASAVEVGSLWVQSNFKNWDLQVNENAEGSNDADGYMYNSVDSTALGSNLTVAKVSAWNVSPGGIASVDTGDLLSLSGTGQSLYASGLAEAPQTKQLGQYIPIKVKQEVTYDDLVGDYSIVLEFRAGQL